MNAVTTEMDLTEAPEWAEEDRARADHYALIAQLFYAPPDATLLAELASAGAALGQGEGALAEAWKAISACAATLDAASAQNEFEQLFVSIGKPEVMLYGSFYQTGFLNEEPLADLREDLIQLGLARREGVGETEDHLAALSEVMRHLVITGPDEAGLNRQYEFFTRHLQPWYSKLCDALAAAPQAVFYGYVGALTRAYFDIESEAFSFD
jgi:TorA maturation chaperone TorD